MANPLQAQVLVITSTVCICSIVMLITCTELSDCQMTSGHVLSKQNHDINYFLVCALHITTLLLHPQLLYALVVHTSANNGRFTSCGSLFEGSFLPPHAHSIFLRLRSSLQ
jgi:hypothetical protein